MIKLSDEELFQLQLKCPHKFTETSALSTLGKPDKYFITRCEYCHRILGYEAINHEFQDEVDKMNEELKKKYGTVII